MCWCVVALCIGCPPSWASFAHSRIYLSFLCLLFSVSITLHPASAHHVPSYLFRILASHARSHGYIEVILLHRSGTHPCLCSVRTNTSLGQYIATPRVSAVCYVKELGRLGVAPYLPRWAVGRWRGCSLSTLQMDGEGFDMQLLHIKFFFRMGEIFRL